MLQLRLAIRQWVGPINLTTTSRSRMLAPSLLPSRLYSTDTPPPPTPELSEAEQNIHQKLTEQFAPSTLRVQDVSGACIPSCTSGELDKFSDVRNDAHGYAHLLLRRLRVILCHYHCE